MAKKGMFIGPSHANGGIPSKIAETNTPIEIEGGEYYICREAFYSPKVFSYQNKTNKQVLDDIYTQFSCKLVQEVMKTNDFIVCKVTVDDPTPHNRKGTVEQILNQMQSENGCRLSNNQSSIVNHQLKDGGPITAPEKEAIYTEWAHLVNMTTKELRAFLKTKEGQAAGLSIAEAKKLGIKSGQESAQWILKMKATPERQWTKTMWQWAQRQINFIKRMSGNQGALYDANGNLTRKHTSLLLWGHNPLKTTKKFDGGGSVGGVYQFENQFGSFNTIKVMPIDKNLKPSNDFFSVQVTIRVKEGENIRIIRKPLATYPISKLDSFISDLKQRGATLINNQTPNINFHNGGPIMKHYITVVKFKTDGKVVVLPAKLNYHDMLSLFSVRENEIEWLKHFDYDTTAKGKHNEFLEWTKTYVLQNFNQPLFEDPIILHKNHPNGGVEIISATAQLKDGTEIEFVPNLMEWKILNARSFDKGGEIKRQMHLHDAVLYKGKTWYITEKNNTIGIVNFSGGAWGSDHPFIPISEINVEEQLTDMMGRKVLMPKLEQGGSIPNAIQLNAFKEAPENTNTPSLFSATAPKRSFEYGGSITNVTKWDDVPNEWRNLKEIKPIDYKPSPTDKGLQKILKPFLGNDFLRPVMSGANFDEDHITATNAHQLIVLPNPTEKRGIIAVADLKATDKKVGEVIEGNYPNYIAVIPQPNKQTATHKVDVYKLLQFTKAAINYTNQTTYQIRYIVNENFTIGINARMFIENLQTCLLLGYKEVYFSFEAPSHPIIIHPEKHYNPTKVESFLILQMPVMLHAGYEGEDATDNASAWNSDYNRSLLVKFDFSKNAIVNADGSVATFKMDYGKGELFNENDISLLKKVMLKNPSIAILESIAVKDGKLMATDLETFIKIDQNKAKDGVYGVLNNVPYIEPDISIDEFPGVRPVKHATKLFTIDAEFFKFIVTAALNFVSDDDLRPVMMGINIKKTDDGKIMLAATDAHILIRYDITPYLTLHTTDEFNVLFKAKLVKDFLVYNAEPTVDVFFNKEDSRLIITNSKAELNTRQIDYRYVDYESVIPTESTSQISFDTTDLLKLISAPTLKAFKDKVNNKQADIHLEGVEAENGKLELYLIATLRERNQDPIIEVDKIGTIDYALTEKTMPTAQNIALIMPIMSETEKFVFALNPTLLTNMLKDLNTKEEANFGFTTKNRAYVLSGPTMEYTKKPATKTKKPTHIADTSKMVSATTPPPRTKTQPPKTPTTSDIFALIEGLRLLDQTPEITQLIEGLKLIERDDDLPFEDGGNIGDELILVDKTDEFREKHDVFVNGIKQGSITKEFNENEYFAMSNLIEGGKSFPSKHLPSLEKAKKYIYSKTKNIYPLNHKNIIKTFGYSQGGTIKGYSPSPIATPL